MRYSTLPRSVVFGQQIYPSSSLYHLVQLLQSSCSIYLTDIIHAIANAILLLFYCMFGYPLALVVNPASKGSCYARTSTLLSAVVLITTMMLYVVVATFPLLYLWEVFQLNEPVVEFVLLAYLVFFATAIVIHVMGEVMLWILIKPLWSYVAKKSHYD